MFGSPLAGQSAFGAAQPAVQPINPMKDFEVTSPPDDTVSAMEFSPIAIPQNFLLAGSWDSSVRLWEVEATGKTVPKQMQTMGGPVLDVCWADVSKLMQNVFFLFSQFRCRLYFKFVNSFRSHIDFVRLFSIGWHESIHCIMRQASKMLGFGIKSNVTSGTA